MKPYDHTSCLPSALNSRNRSYISFFSFTNLNGPPGMDPEATYKFVDIIEVPTDEIEDNSNQNDEDLLGVDERNWPPPIPVNGPNSNLNTGGLLNGISNGMPSKWLEEKASAYSRDFGTFIGRIQPRAHGISGQVSSF